MIWVSCCSQNTAPKVKSHLMSQHSVSEVSPYEVLSVLSHQDLVFLEVKNAASEGFELLLVIKQRFPSVKVIVVYHDLDAALALTVLRNGGDDVLSAHATPQDLEECFARLASYRVQRPANVILDHKESSLLPALKLIDEQLSSPLREEELAKACQYSPTYFSRLFHSVMGKTLKQYIIQKRLSLACGLLVSERDKISNIASASGFNDVSYFSRVFKKYMGCSPGEYRINQGRSSQEDSGRVSESISSVTLPTKR